MILAHRDPLPLIKSISKLREQEESRSTGPSALLWTPVGNHSERWGPETSIETLRHNEWVGSQRLRIPPEYWADDDLLRRLAYRGFFPRTVDVPTSLQTAGEIGEAIVEGCNLTEEERKMVVVWQSWTIRSIDDAAKLQWSLHPMYGGHIMGRMAKEGRFPFSLNDEEKALTRSAMLKMVALIPWQELHYTEVTTNKRGEVSRRIVASSEDYHNWYKHRW